MEARFPYFEACFDLETKTFLPDQSGPASELQARNSCSDQSKFSYDYLGDVMRWKNILAVHETLSWERWIQRWKVVVAGAVVTAVVMWNVLLRTGYI